MVGVGFSIWKSRFDSWLSQIFYFRNDNEYEADATTDATDDTLSALAPPPK